MCGMATIPAEDEVFTIAPPPVFSMARISARMATNTERRLVARTSSKSSSR